MASRRLQRALHSEHTAGWAFAAPGVALIALFGLVPIVWSFLLSFQETNLLAPERPFVGFDNYERLRDDPLFEESVRHTLTYTALFVPITPISSCHDFTNAAAPSSCSRAASASTSIPAFACAAMTASQSPPSAGMTAPTSP